MDIIHHIRKLDIMPHQWRRDICVIVYLEGEDEKIVHQFDIDREYVEYTYIEDPEAQDGADLPSIFLGGQDHKEIIEKALQQLPIIDVIGILKICEKVYPHKFGI